MLPSDEVGTGPAVVLLHAGIADRTMWSEHLEPLAAAGYRVVALDLPGFGEAPAPPGDQAPWSDVLGAMRDLEIDSAALVGNSFGGAVALRAAVVSPPAVWGLALISAPAPGVEPSERLRAAWEAEEAALERGDIDAAVDSVVEAWTLPDAPQELRDRVAAMQRRAFHLQAEAKQVTEAADPVDERPDALAELDVPTAVAAGEQDMQDFVDSAKELGRVLADGRYELIPGAGHLAPLETPEAFRTLLLNFLREVTG
jgi:pimeloyl-ACP methyl ester carboxylesterase